MVGVLRALAAGFWARLMGYISAAKIQRAERIIELAMQAPTHVRLSFDDATELLRLGTEARRAAKSWMAGEPIISINAPAVPLGGAPNVLGGDPGRYDVGIILRQNNNIATDIPVNFSTDDPCGPGGSVVDCIEALDEWIRENGASTPGLTDMVSKVINSWTHKGKAELLPNWFVDRELRKNK